MKFLLVFCSMCGLVAVAKADSIGGEWILSSQNCCRWQILTLLVEVFIVTFSIDVEPPSTLMWPCELRLNFLAGYFDFESILRFRKYLLWNKNRDKLTNLSYESSLNVFIIQVIFDLCQHFVGRLSEKVSFVFQPKVHGLGEADFRDVISDAVKEEPT